jgi:hypothetical protein
MQMKDLLSIMDGKKPVTENTMIENQGQAMTIMVGNSGFGTPFKPREVYSPQLRLVNGEPLLYFSFDKGGTPDFYAKFRDGQWYADMD